MTDVLVKIPYSKTLSADMHAAKHIKGDHSNSQVNHSEARQGGCQCTLRAVIEWLARHDTALATHSPAAHFRNDSGVGRGLQGVRGCLGDAAGAIPGVHVPSQAEVAVFPPGLPPGVLHQPVGLACRLPQSIQTGGYMADEGATAADTGSVYTLN